MVILKPYLYQILLHAFYVLSTEMNTVAYKFQMYPIFSKKKKITCTVFGKKFIGKQLAMPIGQRIIGRSGG